MTLCYLKFNQVQLLLYLPCCGTRTNN